MRHSVEHHYTIKSIWSTYKPWNLCASTEYLSAWMTRVQPALGVETSVFTNLNPALWPPNQLSSRYLGDTFPSLVPRLSMCGVLPPLYSILYGMVLAQW
jgi:hypothetical protein